MRTRARKHCDAGFSLIEVLIAMALLSTVLLSVVTLFYLGRSNVYSGKQLTRATSVAVHANEDINALQATDLLDAFKIDKSVTATTNTVAGVQYPNSIIRSVKVDAGGANDPDGYLTRWQSYLTPDRVLNGNLTIVIMPSDYTDASDVTTARLIQVRLVTQWNERNRARTVVMDTAKFNRSLQ
jgi:prepilin-type N-terminal cleavage/methylation domain-containing protein